MWLTLRLEPAHCGRRRKELSVVVLKIEFDFDQLRARDKYSQWAGIKKVSPTERGGRIGKAGLLPALCAEVSDE